MPVIEKSYSSIAQLNSIVNNNIPSWMHKGSNGETVPGYTPTFMTYSLETADGSEYMKLGITDPGSSGCVFAIFMKSNKYDTSYSQMLGGSGASSSDSANSNKTGIVRLIITDKTFAISLLSDEHKIRTGLIVSFVGDISDGNFYMLYSTSTSSGSAGGLATSMAFNLYGTDMDIKMIYNSFGDWTVLMPFCDYAHGFTTPVPDVYMPIIREENAPNILYNGSKKYYKVTSYRSDYTSFPWYVEADE